MPTYEYVCGACNTRHEVQQKMTDSSLSVCPSCGESALRKLFTNVGVVFKGSGFYRNDSRAAAKSGGAHDGKKPDSKPGSDWKSASDSKPASDSKSGSESKSGSDAKSGSVTKDSKPAAPSGAPAKAPANA